MDSSPDRFSGSSEISPWDAPRTSPLAESVYPMIVVAEPEEESRAIMIIALAEAGYSVRQVADGAEALRTLMEAPRPAVLVAEEELPEFGGFQLAELLALANTMRERFGVVVLTENLVEALGHPGRRNRDAAPFEVLVKPFHINELLLAVGLAADRLMTGHDDNDDTAHEAQAM